MTKRTEPTPQESKFAALIAQGYSNSDAYRAIKRNSAQLDDKTIWSESSRFAARPMVKTRVRELLEGAKLADIESVREWFVKTRDLRDSAEQAGNWNAVAQLNRQIGVSNGALQEKLQIETTEQSDETIIAKLSKGDPAAAAMLRKMIGNDSFDA